MVAYICPKLNRDDAELEKFRPCPIRVRCFRTVRLAPRPFRPVVRAVSLPCTGRSPEPLRSLSRSEISSPGPKDRPSSLLRTEILSLAATARSSLPVRTARKAARRIYESSLTAGALRLFVSPRSGEDSTLAKGLKLAYDRLDRRTSDPTKPREARILPGPPSPASIKGIYRRR